MTENGAPEMPSQSPDSVTPNEVKPDNEVLLTEFLDRLFDDEKHGKILPLEEYLALFPGHALSIAREYLEVVDCRNDGCDALGSPIGRDLGQIGAFILVREIGRGGQGTVYEAIDSRLGRHVALKVMDRSWSASPIQLERFRREAALAARLEDPGICSVHETGVVDGTAYIAMRLVDGVTIAQYIAALRRQQPLSLLAHSGSTGTGAAPRIEKKSIKEIMGIFESVARSLHVAHEAGIVHRDIKPANIILSTQGQPTILDFGLAHDSDTGFDRLTNTGDLLGTPSYMSPEQLSPTPSHVSIGTDIWSLGVTLFETLSLRLPFEAPTRESLVRLIRESALPDLRELNNEITRDLDVVIRTALDKDVCRRYKSAHDFAEDLNRLRKNEPILARPPSKLRLFLRWISRNRRDVAIAVLTVILVAVGTIAIVKSVRSWQDKRRRDYEHLLTSAFLSFVKEPEVQDEELDNSLADHLDDPDAVLILALRRLGTKSQLPTEEIQVDRPLVAATLDVLYRAPEVVKREPFWRALHARLTLDSEAARAHRIELQSGQHRQFLSDAERVRFAYVARSQWGLNVNEVPNFRNGLSIKSDRDFHLILAMFASRQAGDYMSAEIAARFCERVPNDASMKMFLAVNRVLIRSRGYKHDDYEKSDNMALGEAAYQEDPDNTAIQHEYAWLLAELKPIGWRDRAIAMHQTILKRSRLPRSLFNLANIYYNFRIDVPELADDVAMAIENDRLAAKYYEDAKPTHGARTLYRLQLATCYRRMGQTDKAIQTLTEGLSTVAAVNHASLYFEFHRQYNDLYLGNRSLARQYLRLGAWITPEDQDGLEDLVVAVSETPDSVAENILVWKSIGFTDPGPKLKNWRSTRIGARRSK